MLGPTIDMIWVGKLGSASMAAVGVAGIAVQLMMGAMMGLMMGMRAMVARFIGAHDVRGANHVAQQTVVVSVAFSVTMAVVGMFLAESILGIFGLEAAVIAEGAAYLRILFIGVAAMAFRMMAEGIMQASGDAVTPMRITVLFRLFHVLLCPFLIFGWWIFPRMGVTGAATTNIISQSLGLSLGLWALFTGRSRLRLTMKNFQLDFKVIWRIVRIGLPALVSGVQRTFSQFFVMLFVAGYGTIPVAAHTINQRVEMMLMMPAFAFGMASGVLVGQNLGARQPRRAERSAWLAAGMVETVLVVCCLAILLWAEHIVRIFNTETDVVVMASAFMRIAVVGYALLGLMGVFMQSLNGAGDTMPTMIVGLGTVWGVTLPLAYFLPQITDLGVYGIRWGMVAGMSFSAVIYTIYFALGRWKRKRI